MIIRRAISLAFCWLVTFPALSQVVDVTVSLDQTKIRLGEQTTLHVYAQIIPAERPGSDRIFSWYVDLLKATGASARFDATALVKPTSDKNPKTSSYGTVQNTQIQGIFDTFIGLPGAGKDTPVELFSLPIKGIELGKTTFKIQAGTTADLFADFIVAPAGGGDPLTGGIYTAAQIELQVGDSLSIPHLNIAVAFNSQTQKQETTLTFTPSAGADYFVEFQDDLDPSGPWQSLPGSPHNSGQVIDISPQPHRFYRLRVQ
jgi:hypothetical protein